MHVAKLQRKFRKALLHGLQRHPFACVLDTLPGHLELACRRLSASWSRCSLTKLPFKCSMEDWVREDSVL